ncbi:MAG: ATP-binding protein [Bacillota bacterium]
MKQESSSCACGGIGYIFDSTRMYAKECSCNKVKQYKQIFEKSGISEKIGFKEFNASDPQIATAKESAINYVRSFESISATKRNSIALLGQSGAGKTHLTLAIGNNLMSKGIPVLYMSYIEIIPKLKQSIMDAENYQREMSRFKEAPVLLIDDLFKESKIESTDNRYILEIINYRYNARKPMIISSECFINDLLMFDEATGGRIIEMCKDYLVELRGRHLNYRLKI